MSEKMFLIYISQQMIVIESNVLQLDVHVSVHRSVCHMFIPCLTIVVVSYVFLQDALVSTCLSFVCIIMHIVLVICFSGITLFLFVFWIPVKFYLCIGIWLDWLQSPMTKYFFP